MANGIKIGNLDISAFKVGNSDCKVYLGDTLLYEPTPPTASVDWSSVTPVIYVPDNAVSVYQVAWNGTTIYPISTYQGNLPV